MGLFDSRTLHRNQIIDHWETMVEGGKGWGDEVIKATQQLIVQTEAPEIDMTTENVSTGIIPGFSGGKRSCLVVSNNANPDLKSYKMYINARDYGVHMQVSWYLARQPDLSQKQMDLLVSVPIIGLILQPLRSIISKQGASVGLDIFDEQDLRAYVGNAHSCLLKAVDNLGREQNIDTSKINRRSTGFLGLS